MRLTSLLTIWMIACLGLTVACQKKSTKSTQQSGPANPGGGNSGDGTGECVDSTQLLLASAQLPPIDASKLVARNLNVVIIEYNDLTSSIMVGFDTPSSDTNPDYVPDYGLIELVSDDSERKVFYSTTTRSFAETIPVPNKYHGKKFDVRVRACVYEGRRKTNAACGQPISEPALLKAHPLAESTTSGKSPSEQINEKNIEIRLNEDKRKQLCRQFKSVTDKYLADPGSVKSEGSKLVFATAKMVSYDTETFATLCSSFILDSFNDIRQQAKKDLNSFQLTGEGLNLTNNNCFDGSNGNDGSNDGPTLAELEAACDARTDATWNSTTFNCDPDVTTQEPDYAQMQADCEANSDDGFSWDTENKFCLKTETTVETISTEQQCSNVLGTWTNGECVTKTSDVSYFQFSASVNSLYDDEKCVTVESGQAVDTDACGDGVAEQLFKFENTSDDKALIKNSSSNLCIKLGAKNDSEDYFPVETDDCATLTDNHKFELKEIKYSPDPKTYWVFRSVLRDENDSDKYYCLEKKLDAGVKAKPCIGTTDFETNKPQLFRLSFNGGAVNIQGTGDSFGFSSLVSEAENAAGEHGRLCIQAGDDTIPDSKLDNPETLQLVACSASQDKQKFEAEGNSSLKTQYKATFDTNSREEQLCVDYASDDTQPANLVVKACDETFYRQRIKVSDFNVSYAGSVRTFKRITRDDGLETDKCLTVKTESGDKDSGGKLKDNVDFTERNLVFENCVQSSIHADLRTQLFSVVTGGGERPRYEDGGSEERQWYENIHLTEKDGWTKGAISMLVIGAAGIATALIPDPIRARAKQFSNWADLSGERAIKREEYIRNQTTTKFLQDHGSNALFDKTTLERADREGWSLVEGGSSREVTLADDTEIKKGTFIPNGVNYKDAAGNVTTSKGFTVESDGLKMSGEGKVQLAGTKSGFVNRNTGEFRKIEFEQGKLYNRGLSADVNLGTTTVKISPPGGSLYQSLKTEYNVKNPAGGAVDKPTSGRTRGIGGIVGIVGITLGSIILSNQSAGLVAGTQVDCLRLLDRRFNTLNEQQKTQKMACEIGALESELAKLRLEYDKLLQDKETLLISSGEQN